jgi:hypothetical protein
MQERDGKDEFQDGVWVAEVLFAETENITKVLDFS